MINRQIEVELKLTAEELADSFWSLSADDQAMFFNYIDAMLSSDEFAMQMQYVTDSNFLHDGGRWVMGMIGRYANK